MSFVKVTKSLICDVCGGKLEYFPYMSCTTCGPNTYDVCMSCATKGDYMSSKRKEHTDSHELRLITKNEKKEEKGLVMKKPVLYVYTDTPKQLDVSVQVKHGAITVTYPKPNVTSKKEIMWSVETTSDQKLVVKTRTYPYLFYEGVNLVPERGWTKYDTVFSSNLDSYFETVLSSFGLNSKERNDFIIYWAPLMIKNNWDVQWIHTMELDQLAPIKIKNQGENESHETNRMWMIAKPSSGNQERIRMPEKISRGIHETLVVEWGGQLMN